MTLHKIGAKPDDGYSSNGSSSSSSTTNKRLRVHEESDKTESSLSRMRYKGVVPQTSGHWGAQIYSNHQRIWLGTYKSEREAAKAYDSAAIALRSGDSLRNFPRSTITMQEPNFQKRYPTEAALNMIRDGSYSTIFSDFLKQARTDDGNVDNVLSDQHNSNMKRRMMFQKELTPSDVGKLNRLVIPKKYAVKFFPAISDVDDATDGDQQENKIDNDDEGLLHFYDKLMRRWKFRYCYWKSSQSFVFTRGWNRFVKENKLKAKDIITFYLCESTMEKILENSKDQSFCLINVSYDDARKNEDYAELEQEGIEDYGKASAESGTSSKYAIQVVAEKKELVKECQQSGTKIGLRLFGVDIIR